MADNDLQSRAFPVLDDLQMAELSRCAGAAPRSYRDGETIFSIGDRSIPFMLVKSGTIEILDFSSGEPKTIRIHPRGEFTGDVTILTGARSHFRGVAHGDCQVYEVTVEGLHRVLNDCPALSDLILQAFIARHQLLRELPDFTGLRVIGSRYSPDTVRIRDFLAKNRELFTWVDIENDPQVEHLLKLFGVTEADTPVVACGHKMILRNPSNRELADRIGIYRPLDVEMYDLAVVGAGPAGLAAAVYGASEGLRTVMLESRTPGGQAGSSMRIENYLGFPTGITGDKLIGLAMMQAAKFEAQLSVPNSVNRLAFEGTYPILHLDEGETISTKCVLIASGAAYRRLDVEGCERFEGAGVYYIASPFEAKLCGGAEVLVVGGGNSAGQAAVFLSQHARKVSILIRGDDLYKSMSSYLVHRIEGTPNIELHCNTSIRRMDGDGHLGSVEIVNRKTGEARTIETPAVFSFIGASPRTDWLPEEIERDDKGFVRTGPDLVQSPHWNARRPPFFLETSRSGVFAAGDVRSGSVKRIASAVGEGSMSVQFVHEYLKTV